MTVLHIADTLLTLVEAGLLHKKKAYIVRRSKQILEKISEAYIKNKNEYGILSYTHETNTETAAEMQEISLFLFEKRDKVRDKIRDEYLVDTFENLQECSEIELNGKLSKAMPNCRSTYAYSSIFKPVDGKKVAKRIKNFNPQSIKEFQFFLHNRYYPEERFTNGALFPYHMEDLPCLEKLLAELPKGLKKSEPIKNRAIMNLVNEIEKILEKVKKINAVN